MAKKLNSVLGVDIGSQQIKIAEVKLQGRDSSITALGIAPTPEGAADHTGVYDADAVAAVLKDLFSSSGASSPNVVISVAGQASVLVRTLEVPRMDNAQLKEHMQWEISRNIPFAESTVQSDYKAFEPDDAASQNMDVVMAISPQSAVDTMMSIVQKSGKKNYAIDVEPLALARTQAVGHAHEYAGHAVVIVDMGHMSTAINLYKDGRLMIPRIVPIGGLQFTRALAENLSMSEQDAERIKIDQVSIPDSAGAIVYGDPFGTTQGLEPFNPYDPFGGAAPVDPNLLLTQGLQPPAVDPMLAPPSDATHASDPMFLPPQEPEANPYGVVDTTIPPMAPMTDTTSSMSAPPPMSPPPAAEAPSDPNQARYFGALSAVLDEFGSELRRSLDYFRSKGGDVQVVYICGGGARIKGFREFLGRLLDVPVQAYDPTKGMGMMAKRLDPKVLDQHRSEFAVAIGNALHISFD